MLVWVNYWFQPTGIILATLFLQHCNVRHHWAALCLGRHLRTLGLEKAMLPIHDLKGITNVTDIDLSSEQLGAADCLMIASCIKKCVQPCMRACMCVWGGCLFLVCVTRVCGGYSGLAGGMWGLL